MPSLPHETPLEDVRNALMILRATARPFGQASVLMAEADLAAIDARLVAAAKKLATRYPATSTLPKGR